MNYFADQTTHTLLLVEDDPADAHLVRLACEECGNSCRIHHVKDGLEALDFLERRPPYQQAPRPDLVFLDLNMPRMSGVDFLREIGRRPQFKQIPIVVLTTSDAGTDVDTAFSLGCRGFITKPMDMEQLCYQIRLAQEYWLKVSKLPTNNG